MYIQHIPFRQTIVEPTKLEVIHISLINIKDLHQMHMSLQNIDIYHPENYSLIMLYILIKTQAGLIVLLEHEATLHHQIEFNSYSFALMHNTVYFHDVKHDKLMNMLLVLKIVIF